MPRLIIMQGLPASGKSSRRNEIVADYEVAGETIEVVNKDTIRIENPGAKEKQVHHIQRTALESAMVDRRNIVLDNCNLDPRSISEYEAMAKRFKYDVEIERMEASAMECILNDQRRRAAGERYVGRSVILQMAQRYGILKPPAHDKRPPAIICDLDGTLADIAHRRHFVDGTDGPKKNWDGFFSEIMNDPLNEMVAATVKLYYNYTDLQVLYISGRNGAYRRDTEGWLERYEMDIHWALYMRPDSDRRDDTIIKGNIYDIFVEPYFDVKLVLDDRDSVVAQWRNKYGLTCFQVNEGNF